jgi:hypothetical protein
VDVYSALEELIRNSKYFDFEPVDKKAKHQALAGQDVYYSAMQIGKKFYSIRFKFDVAKDDLSRTYKDHKVKEVKISPTASHTVKGKDTSLRPHAQAGDTLVYTLSDLTGGVKPRPAVKVLDANGEPLMVAHGTGRADRVGSVFRKDRATSGPMAFFTDNEEIAEGYARDKVDTSLSREDAYDYHKQFTVDVKGKGGKTENFTVSEYWNKLPLKKQREIAERAQAIGYNDDEEIVLIPGNKIGSGGYEWNLREARGNHLDALVREWLDSGNLYNREDQFLKVLELAGVEGVQYNDPSARHEAVYHVFLNIKNPFVTTEISDELFNKLKDAAEEAQKDFDPTQGYSADGWDKSSMEPNFWIDTLARDRENGTTHAWTSIPDWVTEVLKKEGYDGIQDTGGKGGGQGHTVYIPFESEQVKSATDNRGTFDANNPDIYYQDQAPASPAEQQAASANATEAVDDYNAQMEDYNLKQTAREYADTVAKLIRQNGGLRLEDFIHDVGEEAAKELRKKWPGLFRNTTQGPQLELDVLTQQLQANGINLDVRGLVDWLTDTLNEKPVKPTPPALTAETLKAAVEKYGAEAASRYLNERKRYLEGLARKEESPDALRALTRELRAIDRMIAGEKAARQRKQLREHYQDWISRLNAEDAYIRGKNIGEDYGIKEGIEYQKKKNAEALKETAEESYILGKGIGEDYGIKEGMAYQKKKDAERLARMKQRYAAMLKRTRELRKIGERIDKAVGSINHMAKAKNISYWRQQEIKALLKDYDLKRRTNDTLKKRASVEALLELNSIDAQYAKGMSKEDLSFLGLKKDDLKYIGTTTLNDLTLGDLRQLQEDVKDLYLQGKAEYEAWQAKNKADVSDIRNGYIKSLAKTKGPAPSAVTKNKDLGKQYKGLTGFLAKMKDGLYSGVLTPDQLWDWLGKGKAKYSDDNMFIKVWDRVQDSYDERDRQVDRRIQTVRDGLKKLGFTRRSVNGIIGDFGQFGKVAGTVNGITLKWAEVMGMYLGMKNPDNAKAIIYGNLVNGNGQGPVMSVEQAEATVREFIGMLSPEQKQAAELILQDFEDNFDRVNNGLVNNFNKGMDHVDNYSPIRRLEHQTRQGLVDLETAEDIKKGDNNAPIIQQVEKGFMTERQDISEAKQRPINLDVWSNWMDAIRSEETAVALGGLGRTITSALLSEGEEGRSVASMVKDRFGKTVWGTASAFYRDAFTDRQQVASDVLSGMSSWYMRARSVAGVCWNGGVWLIQTTSYPLFLAYHGTINGPVSMFSSLAKFIAHPKEFLENVYELNPQLRHTGGFAELNALRQSPNWGMEQWQRVLDMGYDPIILFDRWTKSIGWYSVYEASKRQGMSEEAAIHKADRAVRITQPASYGRDQARLWRQGGFLKMVMQFTSATAAHFNMTVYDLAQQLSSGEWNATKQAFSTLSALVVTACLTKALRDGLPGNDDEDDDDPQGLGGWMADAVAKQFVNSWPIWGHEAVNAWDMWVNGKRSLPQQSVFMTPFSKAANAIKALNSDDDDAARRAARYVVEALATSGVAPIPVAGIRKAARFFESEE